jgi:hypothetical protein
MTLSRAEFRSVALITVSAAAIFLFMRFLPTGTNLSHMDFRVTAKNAIDFCDPLNPQFIPVVAAASPVTLSLTSEAPVESGREAAFTLRMRTASGKPIAPEDLLVAHTKLLHLLIVDPTLRDYQHVHPEPARTRGDWKFSFTPRRSGIYRVFADFTPAATARGLYANTDLNVIGKADAGATAPVISSTVERDGYRFELAPAAPIRAGKPADLKFTIVRANDAGPVPLGLVMGAFAHLVAFDEARSGFAHLHPVETDLSRKPDAKRAELNFKVMIPRAGRYVIWSQVNLAGRETFVPFWFDVT